MTKSARRYSHYKNEVNVLFICCVKHHSKQVCIKHEAANIAGQPHEVKMREKFSLHTTPVI